MYLSKKKKKKRPSPTFVKVSQESKTSLIHHSLFLFPFPYLLFSYTREYIYLNVTFYNTFTTRYQHEFALKVLSNPKLKVILSLHKYQYLILIRNKKLYYCWQFIID